MWRDEHLEELASSIVGLKADARMFVVDNANEGDLCEWLCDEFRLLQTLYSVQAIKDDGDASTFRSPRDKWYSARVSRLNAQRCRPVSLSPVKFLERFGGRRFDVVVSRDPFEHDTAAAEWYRLWLPVTTGRVCYVVGDSFRAIDGDHPIPERTPPVAHKMLTNEQPTSDINSLPRYERRKRR